MQATIVHKWDARVPTPVHGVHRYIVLPFFASRPLVTFLLTVLMGVEFRLFAYYKPGSHQKQPPSSYRL